MKNFKKGLLVVIESGSDASFKETQTKLLYDRLINEGYKVEKISFPNYDSNSSALVKMYLNGDFSENPMDIDPKISSTFYAVDRYASYMTHWKKLLEEGYIVIADRYTTSNMVHQAGKLEGKEKEDFLNWLYDYEYNMFKLPVPDEVIFLNMLPEVSQYFISKRENKINGSNKKDIHERNKKYLDKCYYSSLDLVDKYNWSKINCVYENVNKDLLNNINKENLTDIVKSKELIANEIYNKISKIL